MAGNGTSPLITRNVAFLQPGADLTEPGDREEYLHTVFVNAFAMGRGHRADSRAKKIPRYSKTNPQIISKNSRL